VDKIDGGSCFEDHIDGDCSNDDRSSLAHLIEKKKHKPPQLITTLLATV
jgi:hypothetical protein